VNDKKQKLILSGLIFAIVLAFAIFVFVVAVLIPEATIRLFGPPDPTLDNASRIIYSAKLFLNRDSLFASYSSSGTDKIFVINTGKTANKVVEDLAYSQLIKDPETFTNYLVYTGIDRRLQVGTYVLNPMLNPVEIAASLYDTTPEDISFSFLAGWRAEEIAALLPTSGLNITAEDFMSLVNTPPESLTAIISPDLNSLEGFLFPGNYQVMKSANAGELTTQFLMNFINQLPENYKTSLIKTGLDLRQAIILASIIEKETILSEEAPLIASVFINRLNAGMPLQSDPTIQYALGYYPDNNTWWKNPLSVADLSIDSPYNTYLHIGLPPTPICNPGRTSIMAILEPADTEYLFFRAACDGSGKHIFNMTYDDHLSAACD
jgi:UPF0755 protein